MHTLAFIGGLLAFVDYSGRLVSYVVAVVRNYRAYQPGMRRG